MALTRKQLREMGLQEDVIGRIIAAHADTVAALKEERDGWKEAAGRAGQLELERDELLRQTAALQGAQEEAARAKEAFDAYRSAQEAAAQDSLRRKALHEALTARGAGSKALALLEQAADMAALTGEDGTISGEKEAERLAEAYPDFFAQPVRIPTGCVCPPVGGSAPMTLEEVGRMSEEEINDNWDTVAVAQRKGV